MVKVNVGEGEGLFVSVGVIVESEVDVLDGWGVNEAVGGVVGVMITKGVTVVGPGTGRTGRLQAEKSRAGRSMNAVVKRIFMLKQYAAP